MHRRAAAFDAAAGAYERGRPGWPAAALDAVVARLGLPADARVLDLAAGTGKLTRLLVARFESVVAVEPLEGMRSVLARAAPGARVLPGAAEAIPLPDGSVRAVFVAEAIHWFDPARAVPEMERVLEPGGGVAVLHNRPDPCAPRPAWQDDLHVVFEAHRLPPDDVDPFDTTAWREALAARFGPLADDAVEHVQAVDRDGIVAMYASFSAIAGLAPERREAALAAVGEVLDRHGVREAEVAYRTEVVTGRPPPAARR